MHAPFTSFLGRERKRCLAFARNDECGKAAFSYRKRCEITIISFLLSICRGGLAALIGVTEYLIPAVFHTIVTLSAPAGHLPLEGKAAIREYHPLKRQHTTLVNLSAPQVPSSRAQPRDLYCTAAICTHAPSLKRHLGASFFAFPSPTVYRSAGRIPPLRSG